LRDAGRKVRLTPVLLNGAFMDTRCFVRICGWLVLAVVGEVLMAADPVSHHIPADKGFSAQQLAALRERGTQRVYRGAERKTIGMPCGGIGAGQLYVTGDGTLACWQIDGANYFGGVGHTSYRSDSALKPIEQGFAAEYAVGDGDARRVLLADGGCDEVRFIGEYPRAVIQYRDGRGRLGPLEIDLEVFSPFIPLQARESAWPATVLQFTVRNTGEEPVRVALVGWLQNMVYGDRFHPIGLKRRVRRVHAGDLNTLVHSVVYERPEEADTPRTRVLADFEDGTYRGWTVRGAAFGDAPSQGTEGNQQPVSGFSGEHLINTYHSNDGDKPTGTLISDPFEIDLPYLTFRIGGGSREGKTCMNLVVDGETVRTATGHQNERLEPHAWDVRELLGKRAHIEVLDLASGMWGHINVDDIALTNVYPAPEFELYREALTYGTVALSGLGPGAVLTDVDAQDLAALFDADAAAEPREQRAGFERPLVGAVRTEPHQIFGGGEERFTFLVTWHFPNQHTRNGRMYTNWYQDAADVAVQLRQRLTELHAQTARFCHAYYRETTLPWWLTSRLMMPTSTLATNTVQWWKNGRFWGWEGVCCCAGTCTHVWNYAQAHAWLYPELAMSVRQMQDLGAGFDDLTGLVGFRSDRNFAADGQAGTILKCYREYLLSGDDEFLRRHWPRIRLALEYLITQDADSNGVIENDRQHNTYDINFVGPNTFVGALYLAALRAGEEMATRLEHKQLAARYRTLFERGRKWTGKRLYNGEYFVQQVPDGDTRAYQYGDGCLSDQLFGQTWAHLLGLGHLYDPAQVRSAVGAAFKYNWAPDIGPQNEVFGPERWFARAGEPGLFLCTWPKGGRSETPVRYRDEIWTGIEYQLAAGLAWEGLVDEALLIVQGIEQRYNGATHNPYNEVECGDHYARAMAAWGVLHALAGFQWHGPAGRLTVAPRLQQENFACFFSTGTGWGNVSQTRGAQQQENGVLVRAGRVRICEFVTAVPAGKTVSVVTCRAGLRSEPCSFTQAGERCTVVLDKPVTLTADQKLEVMLAW
jgi:non-lysosomal glucosylceramidase